MAQRTLTAEYDGRTFTLNSGRRYVRAIIVRWNDGSYGAFWTTSATKTRAPLTAQQRSGGAAEVAAVEVTTT